MIKNVAFISAFFLLMSISGCAVKREFPLGITPNNQEQNCNIIDRRPETEKTAEVLSVFVGSDNYGIYRIGDSQTVPNRMAVLCNSLHTRNIIDAVANKPVYLDHFEIRNNLQKHLKKVSAFSAFGLVGGLAYAGLAGDDDAYVDVNLSFSVDQKSYSATTVNGYKIIKNEGVDDRKLGQYIGSALDKTIAKAVTGAN